MQTGVGATHYTSERLVNFVRKRGCEFPQNGHPGHVSDPSLQLTQFRFGPIGPDFGRHIGAGAAIATEFSVGVDRRCLFFHCRPASS